MIRINLLPYRPERRQRQILQHLGVAAGAVVLALLISLSAQWISDMRLSGLKEQYANLRQQNRVLRKEIGRIKDLDKLRADVERKLKLVDRLQKGRFHSLNTFVALAKVIPNNVWLNSVQDTGSQVHISGTGESNNAVAQFMRALDASPLFTNIRLQVITRSDVRGMPVRQFNLVLKRVEPKPAAKPKAHGGRP